MSALEQSALAAHPAAELFPLMSDEEVSELAADIQAHGLREPIVTLGGFVLDGRNRLRACEVAGVAPRLVEWDGSGGSPTDFVVSLNLRRRHLTKSQLAMIALDSRKLYEAEARENQGRRTDLSPKVEKSFQPIETAKRAADAFGVSKSYVYSAAHIQEEAPELAEHIRAGKASVGTAIREVRKNTKGGPDKSERPFKVATKRQRQLAESSKARIERAVGTCNGLARGLKELTPAKAVSVSTPEEISGWDASFSEAITAIRTLRNRLKEALS